jgi:hypothetical protein
VKNIIVLLGILLSSHFAEANSKKQVPEFYPLAKALKAPGRLDKKLRIVFKNTAAKSLKGRAIASAAPGAIVEVKMNSNVGILVDDYPATIKERVINDYLNKPNLFWYKRASQQVEATLYRLVYRNFYYNNKGQLPLPPRELWQINITSAPYEAVIDGHTLIVVDYEFASTLLTSAESPGIAEPKLNSIGGTWDEPMVLPADPEHLLERTGYACMDEEDFPPNSVDSENALTFFDHSCKAGASSCHVTLPVPSLSCSASLKENVGRISTAMKFKRLAWDDSLAKAIRSGAVNSSGAELEVLLDGVKNNRLIYRYVPQNSCAIQEGCVGGSGWRRLLQFDASVANRGSDPAALGEISANSLLLQHNMFEFSSCHGHYHFSHYGKFTFGTGAQQLGSKKAFCLESTSRYSNNESTPLTHPYNCQNQGIAAGWGDDYIAGIDCQWVDVTPVQAPVTAPLGFISNPDKFICEGKPILDADGNWTFEKTDFTTATGAPVDRIACNFSPNFEANNYAEANITIPKEGGYVTESCKRGQDSQKRNCGFIRQGLLTNCTPGSVVKLSCSVPPNSAPQALRVCETSRALNSAITCTYLDANLNAVIESKAVNISFICPVGKDSVEVGGQYSMLVAPAHVSDALANVTCISR